MISSGRSKPVDTGIVDDIKALFSGEKAGHLSYLHYGSPEFEGDMVRGAMEWIALQNHPDYYLSREELDLVAAVAPLLATFNMPRLVVDLGPGDEENILHKTLPLLAGIPADSYCAIDFSYKFACDSAAIVGKATGLKTDFRSFNFMAPPPWQKFQQAVLVMLGSTITNIPLDSGARSGLMQLTRHMLNLRQLLDSGFMLISFDANRDQAELDNAYANSAHARLSEDVMWRVVRDTDFPVIPEDWRYKGQWLPEENRYAHLLTDGTRELNIANSFKFPTAIVESAAANAGWRPVETWTLTGRVHYMLLKAI